MRYREYPEIKELYVLHKYYVGSSQGDECYIQEIIESSNDKEYLQQVADRMFPPDTRHGWNWYEGIILVNTATEEGNRLYEEQKGIWAAQWAHIDNHPEAYIGAYIAGNRDEGPIAVWMEHNPTLDGPQEGKGMSLTSYAYIVWDVDKQQENES